MPIQFSSKLPCLLLLTIILLGLGCSKEGAQPIQSIPEISVIKIAPQDIDLPVEFVGQTQGAVDAEIRARVEGIIQSVNFEEGKEVKEGDLLYTIDPAPFEAKAAEAKAKLADAETRLVKANADLARIKPLRLKDAVSQKDLDTAVAQQGLAQGAVDAAKAALDTANIELGYTKIAAPISGIVGLTKAKTGEFVGRAPNSVLLTTVSQLDPIHVRFSISERDYLYFSRLRQKEQEAGQKPSSASLSLVLADNSIHDQKGAISSIDSKVNPDTGSISVEASFPNPQKIVRPGQFVKIRAIGETRKGVIAVPKKALRDIQGIKQVIVVSPEKVTETRNVKIGREVGDLVEVIEGLASGDQVVPEIQARLKSGTKVNVKVL